MDATLATDLKEVLLDAGESFLKRKIEIPEPPVFFTCPGDTPVRLSHAKRSREELAILIPQYELWVAELKDKVDAHDAKKAKFAALAVEIDKLFTPVPEEVPVAPAPVVVAPAPVVVAPPTVVAKPAALPVKTATGFPLKR